MVLCKCPHVFCKTLFPHPIDPILPATFSASPLSQLLLKLAIPTTQHLVPQPLALLLLQLAFLQLLRPKLQLLLLLFLQERVALLKTNLF